MKKIILNNNLLGCLFLTCPPCSSPYVGRRVRFFVAVIVLISTISSAISQNEKKNINKITIVIHAGAGTILKGNMTPEKEDAYKTKLKEALQVGYEILKVEGSSLDAVEAAINVLEDSPLFNAGKGAVFTNEGKNELDASIMDGKTLNAGAVAAVTVIKNPVSAARKVMENSPHVLLCYAGAEKFAKEQGLEIVDPSYFFTEKRYKYFKENKKKEQGTKDKERGTGVEDQKDDPGGKGDIKDISNVHSFGTVGAVALDVNGNLAAGTSTGGMSNKRFGRIGDSPIIGAGTYANNKTCAVSATGHGEYFIRSVVAYDISALMEYKGASLEKAANEVIMKKLVELGGTGGVISVDKDGNIAMPFNTAGMFRGYVKGDGEIIVRIYK
ncbi:MAG: isoaspartyl peptidase/L-asparaginase [Cytophagales bacterium]|nr:isoaspartyl peptidase/L-asparaginase [Cytophagales bacterium]